MCFFYILRVRKKLINFINILETHLAQTFILEQFLFWFVSFSSYVNRASPKQQRGHSMAFDKVKKSMFYIGLKCASTCYSETNNICFMKIDPVVLGIMEKLAFLKNYHF